MLADMATELEAARMLTLKAATVKDRQSRSMVEASMRGSALEANAS